MSRFTKFLDKAIENREKSNGSQRGDKSISSKRGDKSNGSKRGDESKSRSVESKKSK